MPDYRLFCFDEKNRLQHREDFEADDDIAAVALAKEKHSLSSCELWELGRLVARIPVTSESSVPSPDLEERAG